MIVPEQSVLQFINQTRAGDELVESGKIERDLPAETSAHQHVLWFVLSHQSDDFLSKTSLSICIVYDLNKDHHVQLTLFFDIEEIEYSSISDLLNFIHEGVKNFYELWKVYFGVDFLPRHVEV